jgi:hypothetical protein
MMEATVESHHTLCRLGICEKTICMTPNMAMYGLVEAWHGSLCPFQWKQLALLIALFMTMVT